MAYLLRFDGVNDYVTLASVVGGAFADRLSVDQDWTLEFKFKRSGSDSYVHRFFDYPGGAKDNILYRASDGLFRVTFLSGAVNWIGVATNTTTPSIFRIVKAGGSDAYELLVDDGTGSGFTSYGQQTSAVQIFNFSTIGRDGTAGYINGDLYYVDYTTTNSGVNYFADPSASFDQGELVDTAGGNNGAPVNFPTNFNDALIFYDDGGGTVEQPVVSEFSGSATVNALASAQAEKRITASSDSLVTTTTTSLASKHVQLSGQSSVTASSVSMFEKRGVFSGSATVNLTSEAYASKITELSGDATVNVVASGTLIDGNFEIHSFSGGALITASASGQALKVGLVSGQSTTHASASGQASKVAHVDGNATVTTSTQSAISKIASVFGEAISHITASAIAAKRVVLSGASTVITTVYGQFFNTESNVETYQTIVQGRVRANPEVQGRVKANPEIKGTVKSTTIQGRVK